MATTFQRGDNGDVILTLEDGTAHTIQKDHWHSIIATVSYYGEEDYGFYRAAEFHSGIPIHATCPLKVKPPLW